MTERIDQKRESAHPAKATFVLLLGTVVLVILLALWSTFR
jgi:hypothetical protein